jgi:exo-beta-1,3-glucanase (GH17 family)
MIIYIGLIILLASLAIILYIYIKKSTTPPIKGLGVCYDAGIFECNLSGEDIRKCVIDDFSKIKNNGYTYIRTYFPRYGYSGCSSTNTLGMYTEIADMFDLKLLLGVGTGSYKEYKDCIIESIIKYPESILGISIGNEDVQDNNWSVAQQILDNVTDLKNSLKGKVTKIPKVGTCQQSGFWICINKGECICSSQCDDQCINVYKKLKQNLDFCGANVYPGSGGPALGMTDTNKNKDSLYKQLDCLINAVGLEKLWITETGLPHGGSCPDGSGNSVIFTPKIQKAYMDDIEGLKQKYNSLPIFLFMAFDLPSKAAIPGCDMKNNTEAQMGVISGQKCVRREKNC